MTPADLSADLVEAAPAAIARDGFALASRARMVAALKGFCSFLVLRGYLETDPTDNLLLKRPPEDSPRRSPTPTSAARLRRFLRPTQRSANRGFAPWTRWEVFAVCLSRCVRDWVDETTGLAFCLVEAPDGSSRSAQLVVRARRAALIMRRRPAKTDEAS